MKFFNSRLSRLCLVTVALLFSLAVVVVADAEFSIGSIIKKFELPQRDGEGKLILTIFGREATVISKNRVKVEGLKIELYQNDEDQTTMTSPFCDYWRKEGRLITEKGVEVQHPNFKLTADKMDWELEPSRGDFKDNVRLEIKKIPQKDPS